VAVYPPDAEGQAVDLLLSGGWVVTVDRQRRIFRRGAVEWAVSLSRTADGSMDAVLTTAPLRGAVEGLVLREVFCPRCATALEVDVAMPTDPVTSDEITRCPDERG
jgi:hypothetical protein